MPVPVPRSAPGFYNELAVNTLLRWTDVPVEDSFEMLLDVVRWKQRVEQEKK